ncbi:MAG: FAD binding domain-containing protein [Treponema sp.]|nr:FAD binding domain-containing protein [Treponema sp.]MCI5666803.1 FAD binding domain-containing protein [Spirochaetia bacterium]MDD7767558.1 FAD binding domain-containing protein [Treponema sp.]MDY3130668.1 FAD binding domain-containing protein [Treponema sp.]
MKSILLAKNTSELIYQLKATQGLQIVGGCTSIEELPEKTISTIGIKDLSVITRHERFLNVGPAVTLTQLLNVGQNHLPQIIFEALGCIANPMIRNMATVGGNICAPGHKRTLFAPLLALEARLVFKSQSETKIEPIQNFKKVPEGFVLTNIRIPLVDSNLSIFRRVGPENSITELSASFAFLVSTEKNAISDVSLAFAGPFIFKSKSLENALLGHKLPLTHKDIENIQEQVEQEFQKAATDQMISDVVRQQFFNLCRYSFEQLT